MNKSQKKDLTSRDALDIMCDYMRLEAKKVGHGKICYPPEKPKVELTVCNGLTTQVQLAITENSTKSFRVV